ncbi:uncharacterized protein LOC110097480 isoform X2 [Dendrobium catenatum]|nr:uncharacterized protein LOC110097480 isoform X2 [Dendrobium catenatum]
MYSQGRNAAGASESTTSHQTIIQFVKVSKAKSHKKHGPCEVGLTKSVEYLLQPENYMNFTKFSLDYVLQEQQHYSNNSMLQPKFGGHQTLEERENSYYARNETLHCGFVKGPEGYPSTGFDVNEKDKEYMARCRVAVSSCIFGSSDFLRRPTSKLIGTYSKKNVCFLMFLDELTMRKLSLEGQVPDDEGYIGLWKIVLVKKLPYTDMRKTGKVPKFLSHRLFPSACHSNTTSTGPPPPTSLLIPHSISHQSNKQVHNLGSALPGTSNSSISLERQPQLSTLQDTAISPVPHPIPHQMTTRSKTGSLKPVQRLNLLHHNQALSDPTTYSEASKQFEWRQAMAQEFFALQKQGTWTLVPPPTNAPVLGSKWTYRTKYNSDGSIARFKARLVAQGNQQEYGINYQDTFSPVAKLPTIRILFTIALFHQWQIQQLDVANAFLHGDITETIYMQQPKGFEDATNPLHVCHLHKAIYGLRQAPRQWYTTFTSYLREIGFSHSQADPSLLLFHDGNTHLYLLVYVDDILLTGNNAQAMTALVVKLEEKFTMKHLGVANQFLGIKIDYTHDKYFLSQCLYAQSILQMAGLPNCNPVANPSITKITAVKPDDPPFFDAILYRRIIGSLQYLTLTRPDIAYAVNTLSQHMHNPEPIHTVRLKKLLRYIQGSLDFGLPITKSNLLLRTYSDADWASDPATRRSTSGFCTFLGDTLVSWTVKKQNTVSRSSTESEYRALASATADTIWIKRLLAEFRIVHSEPVDVFCDNTSTIALANNPVFHARTKHIEIDQRFIRDHIMNKVIRLLPISTVDQVADILTKPLSTPRFKLLRNKLTICSYTQFEGGC